MMPGFTTDFPIISRPISSSSIYDVTMVIVVEVEVCWHRRQDGDIVTYDVIAGHVHRVWESAVVKPLAMLPETLTLHPEALAQHHVTFDLRRGRNTFIIFIIRI